MPKTSDAPGSGAGHIFQLERALYHLGRAGKNDFVAVEYIDDVAVLRDGQNVVLQEQDKHTVRPKTELLADRSRALWTLQIWLNTSSQNSCRRRLLVTNRPVTTPIASMLKALSNQGGSFKIKDIVAALRKAGKPKRRGHSHNLAKSTFLPIPSKRSFKERAKRWICQPAGERSGT